MRIAALTAIVPMVILLSIAMAAEAVDRVEISGQAAIGDFEWNAQNFAGFYYDLDHDLSTEKITTTITYGKLQEPNGIVYTTTVQKNNFDFKDWGFYNVIGFQGKKYFAGYVEDENVEDDDEILFKESKDENSLSDEQLEAIHMDDDTEITVTSSDPLPLEDGYTLSIKDIDIDNKVSLELSKYGSVVDGKVISPSKDNPTMADKTYYYKKTVGDSTDLVIIAVHFKNAFRGSDQNRAKIDAIWQISDVPTEVKVDTEYDKMRIATVSADTITMNNKDNTINPGKNAHYSLMGDVGIKIADQDFTEVDPFRYYISKEITEPGTYEVRGSVATENMEWDAQNFAGFYRDIYGNPGTEKITTTITDNQLQEPNGIVYTTNVQKNDFDFKDWGFYNVIGFQAKKYFAGYVDDENVEDDDEILFKESEDKNSLSNEQIEAILRDDDTEVTIKSGTSLKLEEGYELAIKSIDIYGNMVYLELFKDGSSVDNKAIQLSEDNPTMADRTYYYKKNVGNSEGLVIISVHFKEAFRGPDKNGATIDGIWQISEEATDVCVDTEYGKMRIASVSADTITMDNKDNPVNLIKNKDIPLMGDLNIKTADQDVIDDANPLRYHIYKDVTIEAAFVDEILKVTEPVAEAKPVSKTEELKEQVTEMAPVDETEKVKEPVTELPPAAENNYDIKAIRQNLQDGTIVEYIPSQMKVGVQMPVIATISQTPNLDLANCAQIIIMGLQKIKPIDCHRSDLTMDKYMTFNLRVTSEEFDIIPQHGSDKQQIPYDDVAIWRWLVTPKTDGLHRLEFAVSVHEPPIEKVVYSEEYNVEVNYAFTLKRWVAQNYQWIISTLFGSGIILWLKSRRDDRK